MDAYGAINPPPPSDYSNFPIDDLLDFYNDDLFSPSSSSTSTTTSTSSDHHHHLPSLHLTTSSSFPPTPAAADADAFCSDYFADQLSLPNDDVAELEWLSQFVDDSFTDFPPNTLTVGGTINVQSNPGFSAAASRAARSKRSRGSAANNNSAAAAWVSHSSHQILPPGRSKSRASSPTGDGEVRRCTHCASEKTPQWRTGPLGPKTLCNACGVRYKSGRLVPEYRPAASPTFVLTQHSNSHRKVMELRRQKEMFRQPPPQDNTQQLAIYNHHQQQQDFKVY